MVCFSKNLRRVIELSSIPAYMGVSGRTHDSDQFFKQEWLACETCEGLQLRSPLPIDLIYLENHHTGPIGRTWNDHHHKFADFILKRMDSEKKILEIGGADGFLSRLLIEAQSTFHYTIVEPSPSITGDSVTVINGYIEDHLNLISESDLVIHSHVLEHIYNPREFFLEIAKSMRQHQLTVFSIPNIEKMLQNNGTNALNFEHTYFLDEGIIRFWAQLSGLEVEEIFYFKDHSIFFALRKVQQPGPESVSLIFSGRRASPETMFVKMVRNLEKFVLRCNRAIGILEGPFFLFGAHIFSQGLISFGLKVDAIEAILDNDKKKQGLRMYGTNLWVEDPSILRHLEEPSVILMASQYQDEIKRELFAINSKVKILEPE